MSRKLFLLMVILLVTVSLTPVAAQDDDIPTVAIIRFGQLTPFERSQQGTLDVLEAYGYVDGENINLIFGDATFDFPTASALVEDAIDEGADVIVTITTPVTLAAINATQDMEDPPIIMFNTVTEPYAAGIAQSSCIHPPHVWGSQALPDYASIMPLMFEVIPDLETVGYIYTPAEPNGVASTAIIVPLAEELGIELVVQTITDTSEVGIAAEAAVSGGAQAFLIPTDSTVGAGLAAILQVAEEVGIPVFFGDSGQVYEGTTIGAGVSYYQEGVDTGRMLVAYLNGEVDIATTRISRQTGFILAVNLDTANAAGVEIPQDFLDRADFVIENGESSEGEPSLPEMSMDDMMAADSEWVGGLVCTDEDIQEQQEMLDSASDE